MKPCNKCGAEMPDNLNFCTRCGNPFDATTDCSSKYKLKPPQPVNPNKTKKIIKRVVLSLVGIFVILFLWGTHLLNSTTYLTFNSQGELFSKSGGIRGVNIDYDGYAWEITYKPDWVKVADTKSGLTIICDPNTSGVDREDHITVKSGKIIQALPIGQFGTTQYIRLSDNSIEAGLNGIRKRIKLETDGSEAEITFPDFCRIEDFNSEGFTLIIPENKDYTRSGHVYVKEDNVSASVFIKQKGKCSDCNGNGNKSCMACGGVGSTGFGYYYMNCYACNGSGSVRCYACSGNGYK